VGDLATGGEGADIFNIDVAVAGAGVVQVTDFNPSEDTLELEYTASNDPDTGEPIVPELSVTNLADGTGASIAIDGVIVAEVTGAQNLDPSIISLIAV
jgi:hypothetical protein